MILALSIWWWNSENICNIIRWNIHENIFYLIQSSTWSTRWWLSLCASNALFFIKLYRDILRGAIQLPSGKNKTKPTKGFVFNKPIWRVKEKLPGLWIIMRYISFVYLKSGFWVKVCKCRVLLLRSRQTPSQVSAVTISLSFRCIQ